MTAFTLEGPLSQSRYPGGTQFVLEAIDPVTRAVVTGVTASAFTIYGYDIAGDVAALEDFEPLYTPEEVGEG